MAQIKVKSQENAKQLSIYCHSDYCSINQDAEAVVALATIAGVTFPWS